MHRAGGVDSSAADSTADSTAADSGADSDSDCGADSGSADSAADSATDHSLLYLGVRLPRGRGLHQLPQQDRNLGVRARQCPDEDRIGIRMVRRV